MTRLLLTAPILVALALAGCGGSSKSSTASGQQPPSEQRPRDSAQSQKLRAALEKCGVTLPNRGGPPPSAQGTTSTNAS